MVNREWPTTYHFYMGITTFSIGGIYRKNKSNVWDT